MAIDKRINVHSSTIDHFAKIIWNYHHLHHQLKKADCMFVLGSRDTRVAEYAADLFLQGYAPYIIFAGGTGKVTTGIFHKPEAEIFADIAIARGVPKEKIIIENQSTNTGDNVLFTKKIFEDRGLDFQSFILVQKPYMERRTYAVFKKLWPEKECIVTSPPMSYEDYPNVDISREQMINIMVGDLQRIKIYPERGFQIVQEIPDEVWDAYEKLVEAGFTKYFLKEE